MAGRGLRSIQDSPFFYIFASIRKMDKEVEIRVMKELSASWIKLLVFFSIFVIFVLMCGQCFQSARRTSR